MQPNYRRKILTALTVYTAVFFTMADGFAADSDANAEYKIPAEFFEFDPVLVSREEFKEIVNDVIYVDQLVIDTRDQKKCQFAASRYRAMGQLTEYKNLCALDDEAPYVVITSVTGSLTNLKTQSEYDRLVSKTKHLYQMSSGLLAAMSQMPSQVTKWQDGNTITRQSWRDNAMMMPVKDDDHWTTNYVGHPYSGATYYVAARQSGFTGMQSFGYSIAMSTVMWEYGIEAYFEKPSVQDLFNTPVFGALVGEQMYKINLAIQDNGGQVAGSKKLGSILLVITDPATAFENLVEKMSKGKYRIEFNMGVGPVTTHDPVSNRALDYDKQVMGLQFRIRFGRNR